MINPDSPAAPARPTALIPRLSPPALRRVVAAGSLAAALASTAAAASASTTPYSISDIGLAAASGFNISDIGAVPASGYTSGTPAPPQAAFEISDISPG